MLRRELSREPAACLKDGPVASTSSDNSDSDGEKDLGLEDFEIIKTIGE